MAFPISEHRQKSFTTELDEVNDFEKEWKRKLASPDMPVEKLKLNITLEVNAP